MNMDLKTITGALLPEEANPSLATIVRTEDNIVVFKVFIEYKDENISKETLIENFATFGKIQDYSLFERQNGDKIFKVTYFNPLSAARKRPKELQYYVQYNPKAFYHFDTLLSRLLHNRVIRLNHADMLIKACPSWEQPLQLTNYVENIVPEPSVDILSLNEYCLAMIFDYLDLKSQLCFSICHERLENIFINMICPRFKSKILILDEFDGYNFSTWMDYQFFKTVGQYIQNIKVEKYLIDLSETGVVKMVEEFCTFVKRVQLIKSKSSILEIFNALNINMLTEIELYRIFFIVDDDLEVLVKCCNLTSLGLAENESLFGDFLPSFVKLQRLSLYNCWKIKMENLTKACKNNNLKWLDIRSKGVPISHSEVLKDCQDLETLNMSITCEKDLEKILVLENLKSLNLNLHINISSSALTTLLKNFNNNLETLKIYGFNNNILPKSIGSFISLRTLWISAQHNILDFEILNFISTFKELEELYLGCNCILNFNNLLPVVTNCHKLKRVFIYVSGKWDMIKEFMYSCSEMLENRGHNTTLTIFLMDTNSEELSLFKETTINIYKMLILKMYPDFTQNGLLSDNLPVTEYNYVDDDYDDGNYNDDNYDGNYDDDDDDDDDDDYDGNYD